ncbi:Fat-like cadherin-related tumor suppressor homolog [Eumeta japonica]|uniref:Fat-like cadherin-related tumor suppressor homolog n=1 Tax=Eumeta variegata TaxID=151549 RepID=A0A4C1Z3X2_EUMVA|nr:Fat-like cadherin-related tumor suppressor homolog [Eumeta japonica]
MVQRLLKEKPPGPGGTLTASMSQLFRRKVNVTQRICDQYSLIIIFVIPHPKAFEGVLRRLRSHLEKKRSKRFAYRGGLSMTFELILKVQSGLFFWEGRDLYAQMLVLVEVTALDADAGSNGSVRYAVRARGSARDLFRVDARSGRLVALRVPPASLYRLHVRACDEGLPARCTVARVAVRAVAAGGGRAPQLESLHKLHVAELDAPGLLLAVVRAADPDGDPLYYDIVDGDPRREFYLGRHTGNLLLARRLLYERQNAYALNVSVTDGRHAAYGSVAVIVINDVNEDGVHFARDRYDVDVEESARPGAALVALRAAGAGRLLYGLHAARTPASLALFRLDSLTGVLELAAPLDRETATLHELTVWVRDGAPRASRAFARVAVHVHDNDEHAPDWGPRRLVTARLPHRAPPGANEHADPLESKWSTPPEVIWNPRGVIIALPASCLDRISDGEGSTLVAKLRATDLDAGENARIVYSLADGGAGGLFAVHPVLGDVTLTAPLPAAPHDYTLQVRAANPPPGARAATLPLHVLLVEPDDAPPRFLRAYWLAEVYENEPAGALLLTLEARSPSTVWFELESGTDAAAFKLNPAAGALTTIRPLDYERQNLYNLSVRANNMGGGWSRAHVVVHVLDRNEFPPVLERTEYTGRVSEAAALGTLVVQAASAAPLVLSTVDADSPANRRRAYEIVEQDAATVFAIDPVTGALAVSRALDYEATPRYRFTVKVVDKGSPRLYADSAATVTVLVDDVNDCPPRFERPSFNATLLLPSAAGVLVAQARATDLDTADAALRYNIIEGDERAAFVIDGVGTISVGDATRLAASAHLRLRIRVSDGLHSSTTRLDIYVKEMPNSGLVFEKPDYFGSVSENSTKMVTVMVMNVLGTALDEHIFFHILNPNDMFTIGRTSGAVRTAGRRFDRESRDSYLLLVEARSEPAAGAEEARVARSRLHVAVTDVNDNCPVFVERPYVAGVAGGADVGAEVMRVRALDADAGDNGQVRYEMKRGHGELFRVERHSGRITLKQPLEARNQLYRLVVAAFDGGVPACGAEAEVEVRVWGGGAAPWWQRARLEAVAREDMAPGAVLAPVLTAHSPLGRPLVYTLLPTEPSDAAALAALRLFELDFDTVMKVRMHVGGGWGLSVSERAISAQRPVFRDKGKCALRVAGALDYETAHEHALVVRATDAVTGAQADAALLVRVEDANDCTPQFEHEEYRARVSEALAPGALALRLLAADNDTGVNAELTYWLVEEEGASVGAEHFLVDGTTGEVRVARALDRERCATHHLLVGVRDAGATPRSAVAHVWLELEDVNDSAPRVQKPLVAARLWEAAVRGHVVARVAAYDPDESDMHRLQYALADPDEARARAFHVEPSNGLIMVGDGRAFAALVSGSGDGSSGGGVRRAISLNISVSDGAHAAFARVKIALTPDNTAPPQFTHLLYEARIAENQPPPLLLTTVKAHDPDWGEYGTIMYSIPSTLLCETFAVDPSTGAVTTRVPLDRERRAEWSVPVMASDGGGLLRHTSVRVRVADLNDNAPVFFHREYRASVRSDSRHPFITVLASDSDDGDNANIVYAIYEPEPEAGPDAGSQQTVRGLFAVDPQSGAVSLTRNASQYESQLVSCWVRATDGGGLYATAPLAVYVLGSDERAPALRLAHADFFLPESASPGTLITELGTLNDGVVLRLAGGLWPRDLFAVDALGRLTLAGALDRETQSVHHIGVLATAAGAESEAAPASMAQVVLHVLDENEHAPVFHSQPYVVYVAENTPPHSSILQVVAEDADAGSNGEVRYAFAEGAGPFSLDAHSGWLTLTTALDRERTPEHRLAVVATDGAAVAQRRAARTTVVVRLRDYDDCEPIFAQERYVTDVPEDAIPGTVVVRLELRDGDYEENSVDMYVTDGDLGCQFGVRASGEVFVARPLDRERMAIYSLRVFASDGKFSASTSLVITVTDVNDNPPHCVRQRYRVSLTEDASVGTHVAVVEVRDADEPQHARPRFYLTGDGSDRFSVDKDSGRVTVAAPLDRETRAAYILRVHAQDRERVDWECSSELEITLDDVNDNAPRFTVAQYGVTLPEDAELGTLVAKAHAVDADAGLNRFVRYELDETSTDTADVAIFRVASDGIVTLAAPLDRETRAAHRAVIVARDSGEPQRTASALLVLTVADVNDNPPRFEFAQYFARVPELDEVGTEILRVTAISADSGVNADVYYAIAGGDEHDTFAIDRNSGAISIARPLDYEKTQEYMLTVQAVDGGEPPLNDLASINITVLDCNDNPPVFAQNIYEARVREDASVGYRVVQAIADDADTGPSGRVIYSIERGNENTHFIIDPDTGYVSVTATLDRETRDFYELIVRADDRGVPALHSTAVLRIRVTDVNDNAPMFTQANYTAVVREDSSLGYTVLRLVVTDADAPPNGPPFTFDFQAGNEMGAFRLEQDGRLETAARFNRRAKERHILRVRVFDNGTPPLFSDARVEVRVVERSQYPPVVTPLDVLVNSYRDEFPGGIIGRVHASDRDAYDTLTYSLTTSTAAAALFTIDTADGTLRAQPRLDAGEYRLNVTVTDGKFGANAIVRVIVIIISEEILNEAVVVRFREVADADFVLAHRKGFVRAVCNAMSARISDVMLLAVQPSAEGESDKMSRVRRQVARDLDVVFAVRASGGSLHAAETIRRRLNANLAELEQITRLVVEELVRGACGGCIHGTCSERVEILGDRVHVVATEMFSLVSAPARLRAACACLPGFTGVRCEVVVPALAADEEQEVAHLPGDAYLMYRVDAGVVNGRRLLADELLLSMRFRTRRSFGTLAFAAGRIDYNILEIENGFVQFRQSLGSGEGTVRVDTPVADDAWHQLRLERRGASVRLTVDRHVAAGHAPPPAAVLDLRHDILTVGTRLERHAHALAPDQPARSFVGCLADLRLAGEPLPLAESGPSPAQPQPQPQPPRVQLMRKVRVRIATFCPQLVEPTVCASYPCLHALYKIKRSGPRTDPCGTLRITSAREENTEPLPLRTSTKLTSI